MAEQFNWIDRALITVIEGSGRGTNRDPPAQAPPITPVQPPLVMMPTPSQSHSRQNGAPGTFLEPIPKVKHKKEEENQFHVSSYTSVKFHVD